VHVLQCRHKGADQVWDKSMQKMDEWMTLQETEPAMQKHLLAHLKQWHLDRRYALGWNMAPLITRALRQQSEIGWHNFILGRHHSLFEATQHAHYLANKSKKTGRRWAVALIKKLTEVSWDMWQHRNSILHNTSDNFHTKMLEEEVDRAIAREFRKGNRNVLRRDKQLFKGKRRLKKQPLLDKQRWLDAVEGARKAWTTKQNSMPTLEPERAGLATWLGKQATASAPAPPPPPTLPPKNHKPRLPQEERSMSAWLGKQNAQAQPPTAAAAQPTARKPKQKFNQEKTALASWLGTTHL